MLVEAAVGYASGSLTLIADAAHMLADSIGLALALAAGLMGAAWAGRLSAGLVLGAAGTLAYESFHRLREGPGLSSPEAVLATAALGLAVNLWVLRVLDHDHDHAGRVHHRAARLHVLADLAGSVLAILSTTLYWLGGWAWVDPVATLGITVLVATAGFRLLREKPRESCHH